MLALLGLYPVLAALRVIGVDVGGTFTDIVLYEEGSVRSLKVLTTPRRPVEGILDGLRDLGADLGRVDYLVTASTLGANFFFGQEGLEPPRLVLITNRGFRDVVEIGRQNRPGLYDLYFRRPPPLIPRDRRREVGGRIDSSGRVVEELDVEGLRAVARGECEGGPVFVVSFINSYVNPAHEEEARRIILEECPGAEVVLGSEADPQEMEYERTSTAIVNAMLKRILSAYLEELESSLRSRGFAGRVMVMMSNGGVVGVGEAIKRPAAFAESGPAAGAVGVAALSRSLGVDYSLSFDMGGTTAKVASIVGGEPEVVDMYELGGEFHGGRLVRGSGYPVRYPFIDLAEVSAGGGTIAWVDAGGALRVGPRSAGADPGPACYGRGGRDPTITDANLVLGRIPGEIAGGRMKLSLERALEALRPLAKSLGVDPVEAASGIIEVGNTVMARAVRLVTVERGWDPADFTLFAFGGAGPLHAAELAEEMGITSIIVPPRPGVFSAYGLLAADYKVYLKSPVNEAIQGMPRELIEGKFRELEARAREILRSEGIGEASMRFVRYIEARYRGQGYTLRIPYTGLEEAEEQFHQVHEAVYGFSSRDEAVEVVVASIDAIGVLSKPPIREEGGELAYSGTREVHFGGGWVKAEVYRGGPAGPGLEIGGPAVVELWDSTLLIPKGWKLVGQDGGFMRVSR